MARTRKRSPLITLLRALGLGNHPWVKLVTLLAGLFGGGWWLWDNPSVPSSTATSAAPPKGSELNCTVKTVYDGDTLTLICPKYGEVKLRIWGIDTPEMGQAPWGQRARDNLRRTALGKVKVRIKDTDRYGRSVGLVYAQGKDLGLEQVRQGYANVYSQYNQDSAYYQARQYAQGKKLGIWAKPGSQQNPSEWRKQNR
jgi:endonuclease YncB( thermonuclease family)